MRLARPSAIIPACDDDARRLSAAPRDGYLPTIYLPTISWARAINAGEAA